MSRIKEIIVNIFMIPELRRRILFTFALLAVFRLGFAIPIPGVNVEALKEWLKVLEENYKAVSFIAIFSGGALSQFSIFTLGIMPYITASIMFSLLIKVIPSLEALSKEGPSGYRKISQYTRLAALPICILWSTTTIAVLQSPQVSARVGPVVLNPGFWTFILPTICSLTAGAMFLMWLGEQITEYGIGNGASLIIMAGIIDRMPNAVVQMIDAVQKGNVTIDRPLILLALYVLVIVAIVYTTQAQRRIPVQYAKHIRGQKVYGGQRHYLPLRVNQAGVMPVIFAVTLMAVPQLIAQVTKSEMLQSIFSRSESGFWYTSLYIILIFFFTYFWTALYFRPVEMSEHLKEWGSFIPGIRPGRETADYMEKIMNRITLTGATFLALIAVLPNIISVLLNVDTYVTGFLGGTGILIVVGVGLDLMQKIESQLLVREYDGFLAKGRVRGRR
ncbi:MAG: preprotein translocase subunit SecY [Planctomycetes bacterium]|nr:preprotein translocase subunit SecY [Planctomycetota bacterium]